MPVVSVLMACHRDTPYLRPAIASVWSQTLRDLELVLVDNGAGLTVDRLGEAGRDPRLRLIHFPANRGIPAAHNAAVAAANGGFIALLDHDDVMLPRRLELQVAALTADPKLGLVSSLAETIDEEGRVVGREFALVSGDDQRRYSAYASPVVTPAYTGRREIFGQVPYRKVFSLAADFDFIARVAEECALGAVPEVLLRYRRHATQATQEHAALIEHQRAQIRLATALRRAGRAEDANETLLPAGDRSQISLGWAGRALAEDCFALAAYQARRAVALRRDLVTATRASSLAWRAWTRATPARRGLVARMFLSGPVRALGVKPG
jgi:glycosyltransferase involved in cell wall biosynthesis